MTFGRVPLGIVGWAVVVAGAAAAQPSAGLERIFYLTNNDAGFRSFAEHVDAIDVVGPQVYSVEADGIVWGGVDPRVLALARDHDIRVMPLIHNPGFNQEQIHALLDDPAARARTIETMVSHAVAFGYWGWQFDFENVHVAYRDRFTSFYREAAAALHSAGKTISVAVVPTDDAGGTNRFHRYMQANWRGHFDVRALAEAGDFISLMTYAQHGGVTTPGPIAALPWMRAMLEYAMAQGVPAAKISLGVPTYSGYWRPDFDDTRGARVAGAEVHHDRATTLIARGAARPTWSPELGVSYAFWADTGVFEWVFLENRRSFEAKLALIDEYPTLRGISVWVLGAEDPSTWDVLRARRHP